MEFCDSGTDHEPPQTQPPWKVPHSGLFLLPRDQTLSLGSLSREKPLRRRAEEVERNGRMNGVEEAEFGECAEGATVSESEEEEDFIVEDEDGEDSDMEALVGEIVYRLDGSAFVVENASQLTPTEVEQGEGRSVPTQTPPTLRTCHIAASLAPWLRPPNQAKPHPILHSFRVFRLSHHDDSPAPASASSHVSKDEFSNEATDVAREETRSLPGRPVLMCFLCHLSFGHAHAFASHAGQQHAVTLSDEERLLIMVKNTSAIIQPVGPGKQPLLGFLEPKTSNHTHYPASQPAKDPQNLLLVPRREEREGEGETGGAKGLLTWNEEGDHEDEEEEEALLSDLDEVEALGRASFSSISSSEVGMGAAPLTNQSKVVSKSPASARTSGLPPSTAARSFTPDTKPASADLTSFNCPCPALPDTAKDDGTAGSPASVPTDECANIESANAKRPNSCPAGRGTGGVSRQDDRPDQQQQQQPRTSPGGQLDLLSAPTAGGSLADFSASVGAGSDGAQNSPYALGGYLTPTHSRNSCKTLKCPKCNWHYKYQQTLEAHMKEKHPEVDGGHCPYCTSGQSHPRLARGETYTCGYKPFRCQVCQYSTTTKGNLSIHMQSDKHLHNMQSLQNGGEQAYGHAAPQVAGTCSSPSPAKPRPCSSWRCEVCDYETNVARNLRIHMTSEKHTHNMLLLQQNLAQMQQHRAGVRLALGGAVPPVLSEKDLYQFYLSQACTLKTDPLAPDAQFLTSLAEPDGSSLRRLGPREGHLAAAKHLFQCGVCGTFSCDALDALARHLATQRVLPEAAWRRTVGESHHCRLCQYTTPLRANFQLHCQTDKHLLRHQLAEEDGEEDEEWWLKCVAASNPVQLMCNACNCEVTSLEKLKLHVTSLRHEASIRLYQVGVLKQFIVKPDSCFVCLLCDHSARSGLALVQHSHSLGHQQRTGLHQLQRIQKDLQEEEEEFTDIFTIRKLLTKDTGEEMRLRGGSSESHTEQEGPTTVPDADGGLEKDSEDNDLSPPSKQSDDAPLTKRPRNEQVIPPPPLSLSRSLTHTRQASTESPLHPQILQCPFCRFSHADLTLLRDHVMTQHSLKPALRCPLCQDTLGSVTHLRSHLTHLHSVTADCTNKLIDTVMLPVFHMGEYGLMKADFYIPSIYQTPLSSSYMDTSGFQLEDPESTKENTAAFPCWQKGCNKVLTSSASLQTHVSEAHNQRPPASAPVSDRHVYKYRCGQCSLAFKTPEKLQLHSQYHAIRAATMCCLCQRSFRSLTALRRHLETSHLELSDAQRQQLCGGLLLADPMLGEDTSTLMEDGVKEEEDGGPDEKHNANGCETAQVQQEDSGGDTKQRANMPFRKGANLTMEKFLDPQRPFKCTVCKESFTQKNILLVHYNSVSHLHKVKRSLQDSSAGLPEPVSNADHKPFKCNTCNVAYSQSSTLEIHMRSVLHQTKARAAKHDSACVGSRPKTNSSPLPVPPGAAQQGNDSRDSGHSSPSESHEAKRRRLADIIASTAQQQQQKLLLQQQQKMLQQQEQQQQQQLAQAQAQLQQELQHKAALIQTQLFNPALLQPFPVSAEAFLQQQQQQLLFPFYIPGGDFHLNPQLKGLSLNLASPASLSLLQGTSESVSAKEKPSSSPQTPSEPPHHENDSNLHHPETPSKRNEADQAKSLKAADEQDHDRSDSVEAMEIDVSFLLPRISHDASESASKALLENVGFELVMQFNESKQKVQRKFIECMVVVQSRAEAKENKRLEDLEKLECEACGKLFSNALILKSHQEHVHQTIFPIQTLEKFAKDYREQYDQLFPLRPLSPEPASSSPPPALPPPQPALVVNTPASSPTVTSPVVSSPVPKTTLPPPPPPMPSMDLPLFPPIMVQSLPLPALTPQMPAIDVGITHELAHLYHQQLTPALLQQQQGKRPRTRITDDQLRVLRQYFDINNSPNEEQIKEMADKSGLPQKVIKHWFRNTLFKERQRNKDSPYNFNNPPVTTLEDIKVEPRPPSPDPQRHEFYGSRRSSRTRFTDFQLRVLQDFFDANAYPKDDEFEQLSNLLGLPTRVIVVWFQNARQKARKNYENQGDGKDGGERRELSNDRYVRTPNLNYQCKKCSVVFQRIFDLIKHQKKLCYKDEDDDYRYDSHDDLSDFKQEDESPPRPSCSSSTHSETKDAIESVTDVSSPQQKEHVSVSQNREEPPPDLQHQRASEEMDQALPDSPKPPSSLKQQQFSPSVPQVSPDSSESTRTSLNPHPSPKTVQQQQLFAQQVSPFHCTQCNLSFPSFQHWQEHQQLHLLTTPNQFAHPQFFDRPADLPFMLFDPSNPLLTSQLLSGAFSQIPTSSASSSASSTINSLKRKLEEKTALPSIENDWEGNGDEPQRDKRMRTTITPEQLEVLYQKYLLDSNPTRNMLDHIAREVGLKKRVVQVWFQNTRARERKGQFRALGPAQAHRRCPFCRALFKAQTALDAHIRSRHWHEAKSVGYNLALSGMFPEQVVMKGDPLDFSNGSQLLNCQRGSGQFLPVSPASKGVELHHLSPRQIKMEGPDDFEGVSVSSLSRNLDQSKLDDECSSVNTAMTDDATLGDEPNESSEAKCGTSDTTSQTGERAPSCENSDMMPSGLVSPATSFSAKDFESDMVVDYSENSSLADPASPCPGTSGGGDSGERHSQKRYRTQMSNLQVKMLKACFTDYKTPTMIECEALGSYIGLAKRVVQVWFQNARAKEKKAKLNNVKQFGSEQSQRDRSRSECSLCCVKYNSCLSVRDHIFSQQHIAKVKESVSTQIEREQDYFDSGNVHQLVAQPEMDQLKKTSEVLSLAQQQRFDQALQAINLSSMYQSLQALPAVSSSSQAGFLSNGLHSKPLIPSSSSNKEPVDVTPKATQPDKELYRPKENGTEKCQQREKKERSCPNPPVPATPSTSAATKDPVNSPSVSVSKPGTENFVDPGQLQALQAVMGADPTALLSTSFMPCFMPGFPPYFPPQIPGVLPGGFLQPMYGMESLFPYGPAALSQALMSLSPSSILQQYQQSIQGALQQRHVQIQQQQAQKPKGGQAPLPLRAKASLDIKHASLNSARAEGQKVSSCHKTFQSFGSDQGPGGNTLREMDVGFLLSQCIVHKANSSEEGEGGLYNCLACDATLHGDDGEALSRHLESPQHKRSMAEQPNAKENVTPVLPHTATCARDSAMPSTSQTVPPSMLTLPPSSSSSSSSPSLDPQPLLSTALPGAADTTLASFCNQTPSLPSTVTSNLARKSGTRPSIPTDSAAGAAGHTRAGSLERLIPPPSEDVTLSPLRSATDSVSEDAKKKKSLKCKCLEKGKIKSCFFPYK
uniref:Zinc finger homeobox protein 3 n=1 Tax=Denticeps clupeoides TaxID=299321 RepID=A0AAY4BPE0_9TELE